MTVTDNGTTNDLTYNGFVNGLAAGKYVMNTYVPQSGTGSCSITAAANITGVYGNNANSSNSQFVVVDPGGNGSVNIVCTVNGVSYTDATDGVLTITPSA